MGTVGAALGFLADAALVELALFADAALEELVLRLPEVLRGDRVAISCRHRCERR